MVDLVRAGRSPKELEREFEPTAQTIRNWVAQVDRDGGRRADGLTSAERQELQRLRRENRQLKVKRNILSARRIHAELAAEGNRVGRKRVARLMRAEGLVGISRRRFATTTVRDGARPAPDLVDRTSTADRPNALSVADITYVPTWVGFVHQQAARRNAEAVKGGCIVRSFEHRLQSPRRFIIPSTRSLPLTRSRNDPVECLKKLRKCLRPGDVMVVTLQPRMRAGTDDTTSIPVFHV